MRSSAVRRWCWLVVGMVFLQLGTAHAAPSFRYARLQQQLSQPDEQIDFAEAKLLVDHLMDPSIDGPAVLRELDSLTQAVRARTSPGLSSRARMDVLLSTLYVPGPWNDHRPFTYDLKDPLGKDWRAKLLSTYLRTRKGNCASMPVLVAIIGQRLGLTVTLATAPQHMLVKFADGQTWLNVEATAGGYKWDSSYERDLDISASAIANQIYLRPLNPREAVGAMAAILMEQLNHDRRGDDLLETADMLLAVNPRDTTAMVQKANAYYLQLQDRYIGRYKTIGDIPPSLQEDYRIRSHANLEWFAKAEALGWAPPTDQNTGDYLKSIQHQLPQGGQGK